MKDTTYYLFGQEVEIMTRLQVAKRDYAVVILDGSPRVVDMYDLRKYEDTAIFKFRQEIDALGKQKEKLVDAIIDKALKALAFRLRLNSAFSNNMHSQVVMTIASELEKLIKQDGKDEIREKLQVNPTK